MTTHATGAARASSRFPRKWRVFIGITLAAAVGLGALAFLRSYALGATTSSYSSYARNAKGYDTWYRLLASYNVDVAPVRGSLTASKLDPGRTLVIAGNVGELTRWEVQNVVQFVDNGGRVVVIGKPGKLGTALAKGNIDWSSEGPDTYSPLNANADTDGVTTISGGGGVFYGALGTRLYGNGADVVTTSLDVGKGTVIFVADPQPMTNQYIGTDDNALYALRLTTLNRPVDFAEGIHGFQDRSFYADVPAGWRLAALGVVLAGILLMIARARRLGPAEEEYRALPPPRRLFIDAFARSLKKARQPAQSAATVQRVVRRTVGERTGIEPDAPEDAFIAGGMRLGIPEEEITAAVRQITSERQFVLATRAFTRLNQEGGTS